MTDNRSTEVMIDGQWQRIDCKSCAHMRFEYKYPPPLMMCGYPSGKATQTCYVARETDGSCGAVGRHYEARS